jgi:hypothetical protein
MCVTVTDAPGLPLTVFPVPLPSAVQVYTCLVAAINNIFLHYVAAVAEVDSVKDVSGRNFVRKA